MNIEFSSEVCSWPSVGSFFCCSVPLFTHLLGRVCKERHCCVTSLKLKKSLNLVD